AAVPTRYSEKSEGVVNACGKRCGAIRFGQVGREEEPSEFWLAAPKDAEFLASVVPIHAVCGDSRSLESAHLVIPFHSVENLRQIGAGVDVGMERIAPAARGSVSTTGRHNRVAILFIKQLECFARDVLDHEGAAIALAAIKNGSYPSNDHQIARRKVVWI